VSANTPLVFQSCIDVEIFSTKRFVTLCIVLVVPLHSTHHSFFCFVLQTRLEANELIAKSKDNLIEGGLLYIATDERNKDFFEPFREHYEVIFLDDFKHLLTGINTNFYGMLDQLIASKGRVFYGTWWSTLSGYVNRMRGYYVSKHKLKGWKDGTMESYYFFPDDKSNQMKTYQPVKKPIYMREFPTSWRDIDKGIDDINQ
jgi:hypothetical protein